MSPYFETLFWVTSIFNLMNNRIASMQIGVLQCDEVRTEFRSSHGDYNEMIIDAISTIDPTLQCVTYRIFDGDYNFKVVS